MHVVYNVMGKLRLKCYGEMVYVYQAADVMSLPKPA